MSDDITAMLSESRLPASFWGEALSAQIHIWNRLSHLRVWGCLAYVFVQKDKRKSLQPHMEQCIFVGYPSGYKGYKFYNPKTKKFIISECAEFDERMFPGLSGITALSKIDLTVAGPKPLFDPPSPAIVLDFGGADDNDDASRPAPLPPQSPTPDLPSEPPSPPSAPSQPLPQPPSDPRPSPSVSSSSSDAPRRTTRISRPPGEWWKVKHNPGVVIWSEDEEDESANSALSVTEPKSFAGALKTDQAPQWRDAATLEYNTLVGNDTWEIVKLPPGAKVIDSGWVFKVKMNADGSVERFKGRIVAKGYSQRPGIDFTDTFAHTLRPATLHLIIAMVTIENRELRSVDITSAFTNGELEEDIYMRQPEGFHIGGPDMVCKLKKSLYGLKQAARQWNKKLHSVLTEMGFKRIESDRSVYIYCNDEVKIIVPIYIDDITFASKSPSAIDKYVKILSEYLKCRDLGPTQFLLGVAIDRNRSTRTTTLHQRQFTIDLLEKYGMSDCYAVQTPLPYKIALSHDMGPTTEEGKEFMAKVPYLSAVGSLQYLAMMTRPDIAHSVAYLARFNSNPGQKHWEALKHLLRYVKGTLEHKLTYSGDKAGDEPFVTYSDSSHGDCVDTGRSTAGYVTMVAGGAVEWYSKLQTIVALSTTEAEYMAAVEAGKEIAWMRNLISVRSGRLERREREKEKQNDSDTDTE